MDEIYLMRQKQEQIKANLERERMIAEALNGRSHHTFVRKIGAVLHFLNQIRKIRIEVTFDLHQPASETK